MSESGRIIPRRGAGKGKNRAPETGRKGKTVRRKRTGGAWKRALPAILCLAVLAALAVAFLLPRYLNRKPEDALDAVFFDVGQADAILLSFPEGGHALIDAGNRDDATLLLEELRYRGVNRFVFAAATHPHEDHAGGLAAVLREIPADRVWLSAEESDADYCRELLALLRQNGTPHAVPGSGAVLYDAAGCRVTAVYAGEGAENPNDASLIFRVTYGESALLLTGDAGVGEEERLLGTGREIRADLLKIGHHGSSSSTGEGFLDAVSPRFAVISCGRNNDYGHPDREVLERLEKRGIVVCRTDREGTVLFRSDGRTWTRP